MVDTGWQEGTVSASHWLDRLTTGWIEAFDALAFPLTCQVCGLDGLDSPFCGECRSSIIHGVERSCPRCALPIGPWADASHGCFDCRGRRLGFDAAVALGRYAGPLRDLCLRLKREREGWLAPWLSELLAEVHGQALRASGDALIAAVPLHWRRRWSRGYNQAEALASGLARRLRMKLIRPLQRVRATPPLANLGRTERAQSMRNAFRPKRKVDLSGKTVVLVDDILTTGATCGAAARALKRAGASRVLVAVIGRAEGRA
jgi:ComF family protein